jgi:hypothetical protein
MCFLLLRHFALTLVTPDTKPIGRVTIKRIAQERQENAWMENDDLHAENQSLSLNSVCLAIFLKITCFLSVSFSNSNMIETFFQLIGSQKRQCFNLKNSLKHGNLMTIKNKEQGRSLATIVFAAVYIAVGVLLVYLNFTGTISSTILGIGIFGLIAASLIFKFAIDFRRRRKQ